MMAHESHTVEWIALLLGAAFFAFMGAVVLRSAARDVWRGLASTSWPRVAAEVVRSDVTSEASRSSDGSTSTIYSANLLFEYQVDGESYTTDRIRFGESLGSGDPSEPELQRLRYPEGARASVVYDPDEPWMAAARPGVRAGALVPIVAAFALLLGATLIVVTGFFMLADAPVLRLLLRLFVLAFMLMGASMATAGASNIYFARASRSWPTAAGEIVYGHGDSVQSRWVDSDGRRQQATTYSTSIVYSYPVDGITHFANTRRWGQLAGAGEEWAADIAARYPVSGAVTVHYDPVDPDRAVLEPGLTSDVWWLPGAGLAFLLFGLAVWIWGIPALTK